MVRRGTLAALALIGSCVVGGCGSSAAPSPGPNVPGPTTSSAATESPGALIGMWRVVGAAGEPADTVLRLSFGQGLDLIVFRDCGEFSGGWQAGKSGAFVGSADGFSMACLKSVPHGDPTPGWLASARAYRVRGSERDLLAANGTVVARLLPGGKPRPAPDLIKTLLQPPTLDPATAQKLQVVPRPLPAGTTPATPTTLPGKWLPESTLTPASGKMAYAEFTSDGSWKSYDGCNGGGGRWALGPAGEFVSTTGATAGVGCAGPVVDIPVDKARRAAVVANVLTLYDAAGKLVARLTR